MDAGRDYLLWSKKYGSIKKQLPRHLAAMLLELEKLTQKMNLAAINDSFDYSVHYNEFYFDMIYIENVSMKLNHTLNAFMKSEKAMSAVGEKDSPERKRFINHLKKLSGTAAVLMTSAKLFMDQMEKEFHMDTVMVKKRNDILHQDERPT